jgi:hypothetical protein
VRQGRVSVRAVEVDAGRSGSALASRRVSAGRSKRVSMKGRIDVWSIGQLAGILYRHTRRAARSRSRRHSP